MRWRELFADLEGLAESLERADFQAEVADRTRAEVGQVSLLARLHGAEGYEVTLTTAGGGRVRGTVEAVGAGWLLVVGVDETLVMLPALMTVSRLSREAVSPEGASEVDRRLFVGSALRLVVRDRSAVRILLIDGSEVVGTAERVGADHLDLAVHDIDQVARPHSVRDRLAVPFSAIALVRRSTGAWA
jgi:hypothetical protein